MRTQVGIVGAGPAGLLLARMLARRGIDSVVLESRSRRHVEGRIRAGVLEQQAEDLLRAEGVGARMDREGLPHRGIGLRFAGRAQRIDFVGLVGAHVMVYGQHEVVKDLIDAHLAAGGAILFEAEALAVQDIATARPRIAFRQDGKERVLDCEVIAGCDGFHGICRPAVPAGALRVFERSYPFAWLGILAEAPPPSEELIYARHERGFALASMRSPRISRLYLQCAPEEDLAQWPDARIWEELRRRLAGGAGGVALAEGKVLQKGITAMRSFVAEPMRHGRLFLAGDAAHIVPPTGAKGMNLAVADIRVLAEALEAFFAGRGEALMDAYSETCLRRIWQAQRFSWWMTTLLHRFDGADPFEHRIRLAELDALVRSRAASTALAEAYTGVGLG